MLRNMPQINKQGDKYEINHDIIVLMVLVTPLH